MRDYASMTTLVATKLQSSGSADFSVAEMSYQIEDCLKEFSTYQPHLTPIIFKIESRYGTCSSTSTDNLIDTTKGQFLSTDPTDEKVIENVTDHTRAVVLSFASTASIGLSKDIFAVNEQYKIYNKRCWNNKQLFIGDMTDWDGIDSVEYPIGTRRNWTILGNEILELDVESVVDSNSGSTVTTQPDVDVLVRFNRPHILSQLTDWTGKFAATAAAGATTLSGSSLQAAGTIEAGEEFFVENHKTLYVVTAEASVATTCAFSFYPPLEAAVAATTWTFTFVKSSLLQNQEDIFADLVAARLALNKPAWVKTTAQIAAATAHVTAGTAFINTISVGGDVAGSYLNYASADLNNGQAYLSNWRGLQEWGERKLAQVMRKLQAQTKPKVKKIYAKEL